MRAGNEIFCDICGEIETDFADGCCDEHDRLGDVCQTCSDYFHGELL